MAKYSTGGGGDGRGGGACELCGRETDDLSETTVAGATLAVCGECAPHGDGDSGGDDADRSRRTAQNVARLSEATSPDDDSWAVEGTDYEDDRLPYLVSDYGARVERARREAGLQRDELAEELGIDENDLLAVEQGRATQASVGGSVVRALEGRLEVSLVED